MAVEQTAQPRRPPRRRATIVCATLTTRVRCITNGRAVGALEMLTWPSAPAHTQPHGYGYWMLSPNSKARRAERPPSFHHDACALVSVAASSLSSLITGRAPRREKVTKPETAKIQAITARFRLIGGSTLPAAEGTVYAPFTCWLSQTRP